MAHGASPHNGIDAITIASVFINEVQKVVSCEMPIDDGAVVTIGIIYGGVDLRTGEPAAINDAEMVKRFHQLVIGIAGRDALFRNRRPVAGSDDFGFYSACVPSIYFRFGTGAPGNDAGVHTPTFGASDDLVIPTSCTIYSRFAEFVTAAAAPPDLLLCMHLQ
ncbi:M20/M25/M40 family metallo-hydrolase [Bradyrhizobium sp. I1.7.5]|uniref:M20/M25/M40 family metallo-hydrolase n=1 Tax=Bradyrhizobium sp. I1.7.5 TaxID=3156363 RepID=UPI0033929F96